MSPWFIIPDLLALAALLAFVTALRLIFWSRAAQNVTGALMLLAIACTLTGYRYQLLLSDIPTMLFWEKVLVVGLNLVYPAWLVFILFFTGNSQKVNWKLLALLGILSAFPMVMFNLPATSEWFVHTQGIIVVGPLHLLKQQLGWAVWVFTAVAQVEGIIGSVFLLQQLRRIPYGKRGYLMVLFFSQIFAYLAIWMEISGANPIAPISVFNLSFIPACLAISWAIYGMRVGQTLVLMGEKVIETIHDSVIVLDDQNCAAYLNPAAQMMFRLPLDQSLKYPLTLQAPAWTQLLAAQTTTRSSDESVTIKGMIYSVRRSILEDWKGDTVGQVFVLRNVTDREQMEQDLQTHAAELARSNAFTQSLSLLAARAAASVDLDQVYNTLRDELHRLGLEFCVGLLTPQGKGYSIAYLSLEHPVLQLLEKTIGMKAIGFRLPELGELNGPEAVEEAGAIYVPKLIDTVQQVFDHFPKNFEQILMNTAGMSLQVSSFTFRLIAQEEEIGMLSIWGPSIRREDLSVLSTFAAQVSAAIQKARLIQNEQNRVSELERTNRFILSLTQVSTLFEAELNIAQILDVLGAELRKLDSNCMVAFTDPVTDELVGSYISTLPGVWQAVEKITGVTLQDLRLPNKVWDELDSNAKGSASIIADPVNYVSTTLKHVPKLIIKRGLRMLGITPQSPAVWMPLRVGGKSIGILMIWGIQEPQRYLTVFSLFARQVATAIEKARLITDLETLKSFNEGIVQSAAEAIMMFTPEGRITFANPSVGKLFRVQPAELIGKEWSILVSPENRDRVQAWSSRPRPRSTVGVEFNLLHQDGHSIPVLINIQTIYKEDRPVSILVSMMNIQDRIEAEQRIRASIEEKEALLKEIHHRVKNNLQIVSSLLNLQASSFKDKAISEAFRESQNRVRSMALIHEKLYRSHNLARIRIDEYIKELAVYLVRSYANSSGNIQLEINADPVNLDIDTAIPCGLIINELVTNSIKHGFPNTDNLPEITAKQICIHLTILPDHQLNLSIEDNGIGFPTDYDYQTTGSLGLQLVTSLTRQLGGEVIFKSNHGARTEIIFTSESAYVD